MGKRSTTTVSTIYATPWAGKSPDKPDPEAKWAKYCGCDEPMSYFDEDRQARGCVKCGREVR